MLAEPTAIHLQEMDAQRQDDIFEEKCVRLVWKLERRQDMLAAK